MTNLKPNAELAYRVLDHIDADPASWDQRNWVCGTTACFAGWAVRLAGAEIDGLGGSDGEVVDGPAELVGWSVEEAAYVVLGVPHEEAYGTNHAGEPEAAWLFHESNTREDLGNLVEDIFGPRPQAAHAGAEGHR